MSVKPVFAPIFVFFFFILYQMCFAQNTSMFAEEGKGPIGHYFENISTARNGDFISCGSFHGDTLSIFDTVLIQSGWAYYPDAFLARTDTEGQLKWLSHIKGSATSGAISVTNDLDDNTILTGQYSEELLFTGASGSLSLPADGAMNIYIVKYTPDGELVWVSRIFTNQNDVNPQSIAVDDNNDIYLTGYGMGIMTFEGGSNPITVTFPDNHGSMFVCKYSKAGEVEWVRTGTGIPGQNFPSVIGRSIAVTGDTILVSGSCNGIMFDNGSIVRNQNPDSTSSSEGFFLLSLTSAGNINWVKIIDGNSIFNNIKIKTAADGIYVAGHFVGTVDLGSGFSQSNWTDFFINKYDIGGNLIESRFISFPKHQSVLDLEITDSLLFLTVRYEGDFSIDGQTFQVPQGNYSTPCTALLILNKDDLTLVDGNSYKPDVNGGELSITAFAFSGSLIGCVGYYIHQASVHGETFYHYGPNPAALIFSIENPAGPILSVKPDSRSSFEGSLVDVFEISGKIVFTNVEEMELWNNLMKINAAPGIYIIRESLSPFTRPKKFAFAK